jgi:hypothetical protein
VIYIVWNGRGKKLLKHAISNHYRAISGLLDYLLGEQKRINFARH